MDDKFQPTSYHFTTDYIKRIVFAKLVARDMVLALDLLKQVLVDSKFNSFSGPLFEKYANAMLEAGGTFRVRYLGIYTDKSGDVVDVPGLALTPMSEDKMYSIVLPPKNGSTLEWDPAVGLRGWRRGSRLVLRKNHAAADFVEENGMFVNATVSKEHGLLMLGKDAENGLLRMLDLLPWDSDGGGAVAVAAGGAGGGGAAGRGGEYVPFMFAIPAINIDFPIQRAVVEVAVPKAEEKKAARLDLEARARALIPRVVQYAIEIPVPDPDLFRAYATFAKSVAAGSHAALHSGSSPGAPT